jgi:uncharacterized SAM-binding protein YcdF (DUF218 family)
MRLTPPKQIVWWISVILIAIAIIGQFVTIPLVGGYMFWFAAASAILMILATALKGL